MHGTDTHRKPKRGGAIRAFLAAVVWLVASGSLLLVLLGLEDEHLSRKPALASIPNHDYTSEIRRLRASGKLGEARDLARYVTRNPDLPGQAEARRLEDAISRERDSLRARALRASKGFVTGTGASTEALAGAIASDIVLYGDIRDLVKQGYYRLSGQETDGIIVALAAVGVVTECADWVDWAPAVLKGFRKMGAVSGGFANTLMGLCRKTRKAGKLDGDLARAFVAMGAIEKRMGLARMAAVFKHVESVDDLSALAKASERGPDVAYLTMKYGGPDGLDLLKAASHSEEASTVLTTAVKKGPDGIDWLKGSRRSGKPLVGVRAGARVAKNLYLQRPQDLLLRLLASPRIVRIVLGGGWLLSLGLGVGFSFVGARRVRSATKREPSPFRKDAKIG